MVCSPSARPGGRTRWASTLPLSSAVATARTSGVEWATASTPEPGARCSPRTVIRTSASGVPTPTSKTMYTGTPPVPPAPAASGGPMVVLASEVALPLGATAVGAGVMTGAAPGVAAGTVPAGTVGTDAVSGGAVASGGTAVASGSVVSAGAVVGASVVVVVATAGGVERIGAAPGPGTTGLMAGAAVPCIVASAWATSKGGSPAEPPNSTMK